MILITGASGNVGKEVVIRDVEHILGRKPVSFVQFARDYRYAFEARKPAAT